ncbi:unnamed protein product [Prunus armeniaca]
MSRASKLFEIVHSNVWGPTFESFDGYKYFVTFVDDFSRVSWLYLLKFKSEVVDVFKDFHNLVKNQFSTQIQTLRSDNGTEYMSHIMTQYSSTHGIIHQTSCVGTPQQNGVAERKNRDLLEKTRALMFQMNVPKKFWSQGVLTAAYLINRLPSRVLDFKSPYEVMKGKKFNLSHLMVFGCTCLFTFNLLIVINLIQGLSSAYSWDILHLKKGISVNHNSKKLIVTRDVKFDETTSFYSKSPESSSQGEQFLDIFPLPNPAANNDSFSPMSTNIDMPLTETKSVVPSAADEDSEVTHHQHEDQSTIEAAAPTPLRHYPTRDRHPPTRLQDYVTYTARHPITNFIAYHKASLSHAAFLIAISSNHEPQNFQEANL